MARITVKDGSAHAKRRFADPLLDVNRCRECGAANPCMIGGEHPETCASCGSALQVYDISKKAFRAKKLRLTPDGVELTVLGKKLKRGADGKQRAVDKALDQERKESYGRGFVTDQDKKNRQAHN